MNLLMDSEALVDQWLAIVMYGTLVFLAVLAVGLVADVIVRKAVDAARGKLKAISNELDHECCGSGWRVLFTGGGLCVWAGVGYDDWNTGWQMDLREADKD